MNLSYQALFELVETVSLVVSMSDHGERWSDDRWSGDCRWWGSGWYGDWDNYSGWNSWRATEGADGKAGHAPDPSSADPRAAKGKACKGNGKGKEGKSSKGKPSAGKSGKGLGKGKKGSANKGKCQAAPPHDHEAALGDQQRQPGHGPCEDLSEKGSKKGDGRFGIPTKEGLDDLFGKRPNEDDGQERTKDFPAAGDEEAEEEDEEDEEGDDDEEMEEEPENEHQEWLGDKAKKPDEAAPKEELPAKPDPKPKYRSLLCKGPPAVWCLCFTHHEGPVQCLLGLSLPDSCKLAFAQRQQFGHFLDSCSLYTIRCFMQERRVTQTQPQRRINGCCLIAFPVSHSAYVT